ncbi:hypothetical protein KFK09_020165 [Dendrobium nobile]|uniref:Uncharacterized protein n=1 Tax=Dendrobium nobile TaxID=94219 RepID=A0A8T3AU72_DENNO|nr:hypothetical protein KFK09_020165 [Dendrobium nobile]
MVELEVLQVALSLPLKFKKICSYMHNVQDYVAHLDLLVGSFDYRLRLYLG